MVAAFAPARSAVIPISPADDYTKIEAAQPGDEVVIAPGVYRFRVHLTAQGSRLAPIVIRAQDPSNKPVWDLGASLVEDAPGNYTAGDRGRGGWQIDGGANYRISGIVFTGCHNADANSAGMRYYNGAAGILVTDCLFSQNDNGITGGSQESSATFEFCEFDGNGNLSATSPTHNMYIYGGVFALRYCYVHDSLQAENFHIRARRAFLEYNWFARAANYEGDLMTDIDFTGSGPFAQSMLVRGNVFVLNANPQNPSQVLVLYNDAQLQNLTLSMQVINNTLVGNGGHAAFVHLSNAGGTQMSATISNNIVSGTGAPVLVEQAASAFVLGTNNWLPAGSSAGPLANSVFSSVPGFTNPGAKDYTLAPGSAAIGSAGVLAAGLAPFREYFQNETVSRKYRVRASSRDIGAFESSTTGVATGPYDPQPLPALGIISSSGSLIFTWSLTASAFVLEQAGVLGVPASWKETAGTYSPAAGGFSLTIPRPAGSGFYRLIEP